MCTFAIALESECVLPFLRMARQIVKCSQVFVSSSATFYQKGVDHATRNASRSEDGRCDHGQERCNGARQSRSVDSSIWPPIRSQNLPPRRFTCRADAHPDWCWCHRRKPRWTKIWAIHQILTNRGPEGCVMRCSTRDVGFRWQQIPSGCWQIGWAHATWQTFPEPSAATSGQC